MTTNPCCNHSPSGTRGDTLFWGATLGVMGLVVMHVFFLEYIQSYDWLYTMSQATHHMVKTMIWGVIMGIIFIGIISNVPREYISSILGEGGTKSGLFRAVLAGVLLDLCSHGILMIAVALYNRGASLGQMMAFLLASPWNSLSLTFILTNLIGLKWTITFIVLSMVIALITGQLFDQLVNRGYLPPNPHTPPHSTTVNNGWNTLWSQWRTISINRQWIIRVVITGIRNSKMVIRWLLIGILLTAVLRVLLNGAQFEQYFGATVLGFTLTMILATVLEVCSEGSTPIAADILNRANAPGNGFAFLMTGVATDYTEIMIIKDTTKRWTIALLLPAVTVPQIAIVAWIITALTS